MAPLPDATPQQAVASQLRGKRRATWCFQRATDGNGDAAIVLKCVVPCREPRYASKHTTCKSKLKDFRRRTLEAYTLISEAGPVTEEPHCSVPVQEVVVDADATEQARIQEIHHHLDVMNASSDALNLAQEDLVICEEQLQKHVQAWASASAGLTETVGAHLLEKASSHYQQQRRLDAARQRVLRASSAFLRAKEAHRSKHKCERLAATHARTLTEYTDAQLKLNCLRSESPVQSWVLDALVQHYRAEDDVRMQISFSEAAVLDCHQRINEAKARYQGAMKMLEALSEKEHKARSTTA